MTQKHAPHAAKDSKDLYVVTGATGALGKATAKALVAAGSRVLLVARNKAAVEKVAADLGPDAEVAVGDLSSMASIRELASHINHAHTKIKGIINIAAVYRQEKKLTDEGHETMWATNHLGPFYLTNLLLGSIRRNAPSTIIFVSAPSNTQPNWDDLNGAAKWSPLRAFAASKHANLLLVRYLMGKLQHANVTVMAFHPGLIKSNLMDESPAWLKFVLNVVSGKPAKAAEFLARLAREPPPKAHGNFYTTGRQIRFPEKVLDSGAQNKIWDVSESLSTGIRGKR